MAPEARLQAIRELPIEHQQWLRSVRGLITAGELDYFLRLHEAYRREAFIDAFWEPRDPDPRTPENELEARWQVLSSRGEFPYGDPRFLLLLFNGLPGGWTLPDGRPVSRCLSRARSLEIWYYSSDELHSDRLYRRRFPVILLRRMTGGPWETYRRGESLRPVPRAGRLPTSDVRMLCADELLDYTLDEIAFVGDYDRVLDEVLAPPQPPPEWLASFSASGTDLPAGAETFEVAAELDFPARKQSRAAARVVLGVPREQAPGRRFDGELFHNFQLTGEVIRDGSLFEGFRYRFEGPTPEEAATVPLGFTRYLRPGEATLRLLLEDLYTGRFAQVVRQIEIPSPGGLPPVPAVPAETARRGPSLHLVPPLGDVHVGMVRFRAWAEGELDEVRYYLDGRPVFSKRRPPYSVELDLGPAPLPRSVRVAGSVGGREVATDQIWLNQGARIFRVRLVEPRPGAIYPGGLTARAVVETPGGAAPERLELYLDDEPVATLREPPFVRSLRLPVDGSGPAAVVRAVAYLADGSWAEDAVVVNAAFGEAVDVRLVELPALVSDAAGRPIRGLGRDRFRLYEDGVLQAVERFEEVGAAPVHAALLIDRSASMEPHLARVADAARAFAGAAVASPDDRVAVLSFAQGLTVDAGFTAGRGQLERALAGLDADGRTAFYDSLVQAFNTFDGVSGPSALVVFTDGQDETSRLGFGETLETARRSGVTLYAIGTADAYPEKQTRRQLEELAAETGGRAYFLAGLDDLEGVYLGILDELRGRYLLAYAPPSAGAEGFRKLRVEVDAQGAEVRTRRGYYP